MVLSYVWNWTGRTVDLYGGRLGAIDCGCDRGLGDAPVERQYWLEQSQLARVS
jgi:hypothetical protein